MTALRSLRASVRLADQAMQAKKEVSMENQIWLRNGWLNATTGTGNRKEFIFFSIFQKSYSQEKWDCVAIQILASQERYLRYQHKILPQFLRCA